MSMEELSDLFQGGLEKDFGYDDDQVIETLRASMEDLHRSKSDLPPPAEDNSELPKKPFGQFVQPTIEKLIGRRLSDIDTGFASGISNNNRQVIPADGGPVVALGPTPQAKRLSDGSGLSSSRHSEFTDNFDTATEGGFSRVSAKDYRSSQTSFLDNFLDVESVETSVRDHSGSINTLNDEGQTESMDFEAETDDFTWDEDQFHEFTQGNHGDTLVPLVHGTHWNRVLDGEKEKIFNYGAHRNESEARRKEFLSGKWNQSDTRWREIKPGEGSSKKQIETVGKNLTAYNRNVSVISVNKDSTVTENQRQSTVVTLAGDDRGPTIKHVSVTPLMIQEFFAPANGDHSPVTTPTQELYNGYDFGAQQPKTGKASKIPLVTPSHFRLRPAKRQEDSYNKRISAAEAQSTTKHTFSSVGSKVSLSSSGVSSLSNPNSSGTPFGGSRRRSSATASEASMISQQSSKTGCSIAGNYAPISSKVISPAGQVGSRLVFSMTSAPQPCQKPRAAAKSVHTVRI